MSFLKRRAQPEASAPAWDAHPDTRVLEEVLERDGEAIARAAAELERPLDLAIRARLEQAGADLSALLLRDVSTPTDQQTLRDMVFESCGFVELAGARTVGLDDLLRCCLAWREATLEALDRCRQRSEAEPTALARIAALAGEVFDEVLLRVCSAVESERQSTDERLRFLATHDPLTGLPNRGLISEQLERLADRRRGSALALVFVDLDDFKTVNDTLGHSAGDELLCQVTARLSASVRDSDIIGRLGGDEFVVLVEEATGSQAPELVAERLLEAFREPFILAEGSASLRVSASIGIASSDWSAPATLLRDADLAMYRAKALGKDRAELTCRLRRSAS